MSQDQALYRCINAGCGRGFPRRVNFCPWCGTAQQAGAAPVAPSLDKVAPTVAPLAAAADAVQPTVPPPSPSPPPPQPPPSPPRTAPPQPAPPGATPFGNRPASGPAPRAPAAGASGAAAPVQRRERSPTRRRPVRLRWWIVILGALWLLWLIANPSQALIERRMESAIALAKECKPRAAQDALIELRSTRASSEQLRQVQDALNKAAGDCSRAEQRREAWEAARLAVEKLLKASAYDKARTRLAAFTRRWGEDEGTRALKQRIEAGKREHPLADPARGAR
ncbi:hypothetical protein [Massilia niastensis]|uniref:hypothetical protein n=1 Tax=Massilia niastensis TaxID=544911 RepID=UPI0004763E0E|nr:hypothetical protein [Massilia niastensis]